jgi:hypothetical protein
LVRTSRDLCCYCRCIHRRGQGIGGAQVVHR